MHFDVMELALRRRLACELQRKLNIKRSFSQGCNLKQKFHDIVVLLLYLLRADLTIAARALLTMPLRYLKLTPEYNCSLLFPVFDPIESLATIKNVLSQSDENTKIVVFLNGPDSRQTYKYAQVL